MLYYRLDSRQSAALIELEEAIHACEFDDTLELPPGVNGCDANTIDDLRDCIVRFQKAWDMAVPLPYEEDIEEEEDVDLDAEDDVE